MAAACRDILRVLPPALEKLREVKAELDRYKQAAERSQEQGEKTRATNGTRRQEQDNG